MKILCLIQFCYKNICIQLSIISIFIKVNTFQRMGQECFGIGNSASTVQKKRSIHHQTINNSIHVSLTNNMLPQHQKLWQRIVQQNSQKYLQKIQTGKITIDNRCLNFCFKYIGEKPETGYRLVFGFHGGGGCPKQTNDQQYENHKTLYDGKLPNGTIWLTPRSVEDVWNMWFLNYLQDFYEFIIRGFVMNGIVNPNQIFITGYSAGGDGIYQITPRMVDLLAGAAMMAGHPNGVDLINLRNLPFCIEVGGNDSAYSRNSIGRQYIQKLNKLKAQYGGFIQNSHVRNTGHWMNLQETEIFPWLFNQKRNPYPDVILFKKAADRQKYFYYIRIEQQTKKSLVKIRKEGNNFYIEADIPVIVYINRKMIDFSSLVTVYHNGVISITKMPEIRKEIMIKTLEDRLDPEYIFDDQLISKPKQ